MRRAKSKRKQNRKRVIGLGSVKKMQRGIAKIVDKPPDTTEESIEGINVEAVTSSLQHGNFSPTHPLYHKFNHAQADQVPLNTRDLDNVANHLYNNNMRSQGDQIKKISKIIPPNGLVTIRDLSDRPLPEPEQPQITEEQAKQLMEMMKQNQDSNSTSSNNNT